MKKKVRKRIRLDKWRVIIDRCFQHGPKPTQSEWLYKFKDQLKLKIPLSLKQRVLLVRIAKSLAAYFHEPNRHLTLNQKLKLKAEQVAKDKAFHDKKISEAPVILRRRG